MATERMEVTSDTMLVHNARIYRSGEEDYCWMTFDKRTGRIQSLARSNPPISRILPENSLDVEGKRVLPGLQESHMHLGSYSETLANLDLYNCSSIEALQKRLQKFAEDSPDKKWLVGGQWEQDKLGKYPTRQDLDEVCGDRPVILDRICGHITVLNSAGLKEMGIDKTTKDPDGAQFDRYPEGHAKAGDLTGVLREASCLYAHLIAPTTEEMIPMLEAGLANCLKYGVTSSHTLEVHTWEAFCSLADDDCLPIRIFFAPYYSSRNQTKFPSAGETRGPMLSCDRIKLFSDGALGVCTAALSVPYKGTENKGLLLQSQDELTYLVADATSRGYRLEIHAIGDAGADAVVTALERAQVAPEKRPILTHCQILRKETIEKMKRQGVIASLQPQFVLTDSRWLDDLLPEELTEYLYPWKTLLDKGIPCCGGSDAPVESPEPLVGIYDAIFRPADVRGPESKKCFRPKEKLTVTEAIDLYTKGGAYASMREHCLGQLMPGYLADFVVIEADRDVCAYPEEFCRAKPAQVWVGGVRKL